MKNKKAYIIGGVIILVVFALVIGVNQKKQISQQKLGTIKKGPIIEAVYSIGTVTANKSYTLKVAIASNVNQIFVREGDFLTKGQNLIKLEETPVFKAPFDGTVTHVNYKVGETVAPQSQILSMLDMKDRYLISNLEQQGAVKVKMGQTARLSFEALRDKTFFGKIEAIYVKDGQFTARISGSGLPDSILHGMTMDVAIVISEKNNVILAPTAGLKNGAFQKITGKSQTLVPVKSGLMDGEYIEILEGDLKENDQVLLSGG